MNAPFSPSSDPDELASALLDGLLTDEEAHRARQDPAVNRRIEELLRVRHQLRTTPPPPEGHRERAVAAALAEYDPMVRPLRRVAAPAARPRVAGWLAAAAAILVVLFVAAAGITSWGEGDDDESAGGSADSGAEEESSSQDDGGAAPEASADELDTEARDTTTADAPLVVEDLVNVGSVETVEDLNQSVAAVRSGFPEEDDATAGTTEQALPPVPPGSTTCPAASVAGDPARGTVTFVGQGLFRNVAVVVHVYQTPSGTEQLVATTADCIDVVDAPYEG